MSKIELDINREMYPSNSQTKKVVESMPERRVSKIVTGQVTYKSSLAKKFKNAFFGEDVLDIKKYIFDEIVMPGIKGIVTDIFYGFGESIEMALFGTARGRTNWYKNSNNPTRIPYGSFSRESPRRFNETAQSRIKRYDMNIILESRQDGEQIINMLVDIIDQYGMARVADLNVMLDRTGDFTDNDWGWTELGSASVTRVRGGYLLDLPQPVSLKGA